eukprot:2651407-Heterocapsa_arctica.AAC.1
MATGSGPRPRSPSRSHGRSGSRFRSNGGSAAGSAAGAKRRPRASVWHEAGPDGERSGAAVAMLQVQGDPELAA